MGFALIVFIRGIVDLGGFGILSSLELISLNVINFFILGNLIVGWTFVTNLLALSFCWFCE